MLLNGLSSSVGSWLLCQHRGPYTYFNFDTPMLAHGCYIASFGIWLCKHPTSRIWMPFWQWSHAQRISCFDAHLSDVFEVDRSTWHATSIVHETTFPDSGIHIAGFLKIIPHPLWNGWLADIGFSISLNSLTTRRPHPLSEYWWYQTQSPVSQLASLGSLNAHVTRQMTIDILSWTINHKRQIYDYPNLIF